MTNLRKILSKKNTLVYFLLMAVVLSCGVKDKPGSGVENVVTPAANLPDGVFSSKNRKFLFRPLFTTLKPGEENEVTYTVVNEALVPISVEGHSFEVEYRMPDMPQMGVFQATSSIPSPGQLKAIYDIVHGGVWEVKVIVKSGETILDEFTTSYKVSDE